jgi:hypothetical protein
MDVPVGVVSVKSGTLDPTAGVCANAVVPIRSVERPRRSQPKRLNPDFEDRGDQREVRPFDCMQRRS